MKSKKEKVYCRDCENFNLGVLRVINGVVKKGGCVIKIKDYVTGESKIEQNPYVQNEFGSCKDYKAKEKGGNV